MASDRLPPRRTLALATVIVLAAALIAPALAGPQAPALAAPAARGAAISPPGSLVMVGGSLFANRTIVREIIALAGGPGVARIGIITAASRPPKNAAQAADDTLENSVTDGRYYARLFERFGAASTYRVPLDTSASGDWPGDTYGADRVDDPAVVDRVGRMTGYFFGGGDQMRYVDVLQSCPSSTCSDTPVLASVRERLAAGAVVAGSSAGTTIMQGTAMPVSGESWDAWAHGVKDDDQIFGNDAVVRDEGGFGFFDAGVLDSHVSERGRQGRLVRIAMYADQDYAYGVDETTALVVRRVGTATERMSVLGVGGVQILDLSQATFTTSQIRGVRWSWLRSGDGYDPQTHDVIPRDRREAVPTARQTPDLSVTDIWSVRDAAARRMSALGVDLARSGKSTARGITLENSPRFEVVLTDDGVTRTWQSKKGDIRRAFADLKLTIHRL